MRVFLKLSVFTFCFISGLFSFPDILAEEQLKTVSERITAHAFVNDPVGITSLSNSELTKKTMVLRIPENNTVAITMNDYYESYSSDSVVSLILLDHYADNSKFENQSCTLTVFFPYQ